MRITTEASLEPNTLKTKVLTLRVTEDEEKILAKAARRRRITMSGYLARSALVVAENPLDLLAVA